MCLISVLNTYIILFTDDLDRGLLSPLNNPLSMVKIVNFFNVATVS